MAGHMDEAAYKADVSNVWRVTAILSVITIVEVVMALIYIRQPYMPLIALNIILAVLSLGKAFYIVGEFMHLKHENKVLIITLGLPLIFLVWALIAFVHEANAWSIMKTLGGFGQ